MKNIYLILLIALVFCAMCYGCSSDSKSKENDTGTTDSDTDTDADTDTGTDADTDTDTDTDSDSDGDTDPSMYPNYNTTEETSENETLVNNERISEQHDYLASEGIATELHLNTQGTLDFERFAKIPGISKEDSIEVFNWLVSGGIFDAQGVLSVDIADFEDAYGALDSGTLSPQIQLHMAQIKNQVKEVIGLHQMTGDFANLNAEFFDLAI